MSNGSLGSCLYSVINPSVEGEKMVFAENRPSLKGRSMSLLITLSLVGWPFAKTKLIPFSLPSKFFKWQCDGKVSASSRV